MSGEWTLRVADEAALGAIAARLAVVLSGVPGASLAGAIVALRGDLGAGKTSFVRALLRGLGYRGAVRSPTYTLVEPYETRPRIIHADLYRLGGGDEIGPLGLREQLGAGAVAMVEWYERAEGALPAPDLTIALAMPPGASEATRDLTVGAGTARGRGWLAAWRDA